MYINYRLMIEKGILMSELIVLITINQKDAHLLKDVPYEKLEEDNLITYISGSGDKSERVRLSKNGKALLDALTTQNATEEILELTTKLIDLYESYGRETGNAMEIKDRLIWFKEVTGISEKVILDIVEDYLSTSKEYSMRLDNLIWKPQAAAFSLKFNLSDSRLFELVRRKFNLPISFYLKPNNKRTQRDNWLFDIMKLKVPRGLDSDCYWTGSEKGDKEALKRLKHKFLKI